MRLSEQPTGDYTQSTHNFPHVHLNNIFQVSDKYLKRVFDENTLHHFKAYCFENIRGDRESTIEQYIDAYYNLVKREYQTQYEDADSSLNKFIFSGSNVPKMMSKKNIKRSIRRLPRRHPFLLKRMGLGRL